MACTLSVSNCNAWKIWFITGSLDGDVQSVFMWLVSVAKIAVVLREFSFVFCRKVVDRQEVVAIWFGILTGMSLFVALHWSGNDLFIVFVGILVISSNAYRCSWFSRIFS